ncbi:MAG: CvpA family protein [Clostridia bacterium]|nr:CvpA family protein [Clostridia bacterium]
MVANVIFDIMLVGILLAGAIMGIKNGFVDIIARPVKFVAALALAISLASVVGSAIIEPIIGPAISHKLSEVLVEEYSEITASTANESLPTLIKFAASLCGVDIEGVASSADGITVIEAIVDAVTAPVVQIVGVIAGFIIVFFVSKILLNLLMLVVNSVVNNGIAGAVNRTLGCVFTLFLAFIVAWAFTSLSEFILNIPAIASAEWVQEFTGGPIYNFFRSFTPLDLLLSF